MDVVLYDELLQEIFHRLPPSSSPSISLVSRRWLSLLRSSLTTLSLRLPNPPPPFFLPSILPRYSSLSTLTLLSDPTADPSPLFPFPFPPLLVSDYLLLSLAYPSSPDSRRRCRLRHLRFLFGPVSSASLIAVSHFLPFQNLTSLQLSSLRPLYFRWLLFFPLLKDLSILDCSSDPALQVEQEQEEGEPEEFPLESLSLCGIPSGNLGLRWLWRRCSNLRQLHLRGCEGTGDGHDPSHSFACSLRLLDHLELRTCRSIADWVLSQVADHCRSLNSLLLYDGSSRDGLRHFIRRCSAGLRVLDFRLPLDLDNTHLNGIAKSFRGLTSLRLQSCCLVTGDGLRALGEATGCSIEELVLINCDVVEREPGLLTFLGQSLRRIRRLDLSHNEMLADRELGSMLATCQNLVDIRLRGCGGLTDAVLVSMSRSCEFLEAVDVTNCYRISAHGVEFFIVNSRRLNRIHVEGCKVSDIANAWASRRSIEVC